MKSFAVDPPYAAASRPSTSSFPGREDCWTEEATSTLLDAWGERYIDLNRGNLRQKNWQEVADAVNHRHGNVRNARRTDIQCKNRIDTLKKKYKIEKTRVSDSGDYAGTWQFFHQLDSLIGDHFPAKKPSPPANGNNNRNAHSEKSPAWTLAPVGRRSNTQKRPRPIPAPVPESSPDRTEDFSFHRNFSSFAAVVSAVADSENSNGNEKRKRGRGFAEAIERFGEIYERVEAAKQRQMVELEKQRMQFTKDLEILRMQLFMEMQLQLQKNKLSKSKRSSTSGELLFFHSLVFVFLCTSNLFFIGVLNLSCFCLVIIYTVFLFVSCVVTVGLGCRTLLIESTHLKK